jgi:hypothetical protein
MKKIVLFLIAAILLSLATASSASVSYSHDAETTGRMMVDENYRFNTHGNPIVGDRYSLDLTAINSETARCNHDFSAEDREINSETDVLYSRNTSEILGGLYLEENSGASLLIEDSSCVGYYESAIGFYADVDSLRLSSEGWTNNGSQRYNITTSGDGNFDADLDAASKEGIRDNGNYALLSEERISSHVGARFGDFNFTANYNVTRDPYYLDNHLDNRRLCPFCPFP